jgi:hypothetical protein
LRIRVKDPNRLRAQQIAQEIGFIFPQLVERRFPRLHAPVWDPAHLVGRPGRHWGRNLGIAAGVAALLWLLALGPLALRRLAAVLQARPPRAPAPVAVPAPARSLAPAPSPAPAPTPAPPSVAVSPEPEPEPPPVEPAPAPPLLPEPEPQPPAEPEPAPAPESEPGPLPPEPQPEPISDRGDWNFGELERLVHAHSGDFPDRAEEWEIYLESIREYAAPDGQLPSTLDWLIWDTFGDLLERRAR